VRRAAGNHRRSRQHTKLTAPENSSCQLRRRVTEHTLQIVAKSRGRSTEATYLLGSTALCRKGDLAAIRRPDLRWSGSLHRHRVWCLVRVRENKMGMWRWREPLPV
jgi:hypothetical protein